MQPSTAPKRPPCRTGGVCRKAHPKREREERMGYLMCANERRIASQKKIETKEMWHHSATMFLFTQELGAAQAPKTAAEKY